MSQLQNDAAFCLAKALHHIKAGSFYFGQTINEAKATHGAKQFLKDRERECERILSVVLMRISTDDMKNEIKKELQDPLWLDSMCDGLISLTPGNREKMEDYMRDLLNGQSKAA